MNHIFINEQNIRQLIQRLVSSESFQNGTFQLYQDVALKHLDYTAPCFRRRRNLATMDESTALQSIDFLVCRQAEAVLAITFDIDIKESEALFNTVLYGLPHYSVNLLSFFAIDVTDTLWQILQLLGDMESEENPVSTYVLHTAPMEPAPTLHSLQEKKLTNSEDFATLYARDCGLIFRVTAHGAVPHLACKAREGFLQTQNPDFTSVDVQKTDALQALLDAPLKDFLQCDSGLTLKEYLAAPDEQLHTVATALCDPSNVWRFAILQMPLRDYFEAAACLSRSNFPLWKYRHDVRPFLNPGISEDSFTLADALQNALAEDARPTLHELLSLSL